MTASQAMDRLKELRALPPLPSPADTLDRGERIVFLDTVQFVRRNGFNAINDRSNGPDKKTERPELKMVELIIDWEPVLRTVNLWYDRSTAALRLNDRVARDKEIKEINEIVKELRALKESVSGREKLDKLIKEMDQLDKKVGKAVGDLFVSLMMPEFGSIQNAHDRIAQGYQNLFVAFALAAYHSDNSRYPAKLDDLAPKYLAAIPNDLFSGKALIYRPSEKGYLFYSVGVNGRDDGGRTRQDEPPGDDLSVRMPLPESRARK